MGPFVERRSGAIGRTTDVLDCCCVHDPEWSISRWADRFDRPETWPRLPNFAFRGSRRRKGSSRTRPAPCYRPEIYPALATGMKLLLFAVETARGLSQNRFEPCANEMAALLTLHRVRAFQCVGSEPTAAQVEALGTRDPVARPALVVWADRRDPRHAVAGIRRTEGLGDAK